jgi:predicted Ser/Thr protein kinase/tetratricopeptide (TPR) repeat protein
MSEEKKCAQCGAPLPAGTPEGLCPACLLKRGFETQTAGGIAGEFTPPGVEELAAKFPQLEITDFIGRGGMGAVYKARQKELGRVVALKILPPDVGKDPAFAERFAREAKALAMLNHPGIITIYDFGRADGLYYLLMEFVDGVNLRQLLDAGRISPREALAIVPQICDALQFAHDRGIVHRDIKPENILLDRLGRVKVADFGIVKLIGAENEPGAAPEAGPGSPELTEAGKIMGTPSYMAPEQFEHPADVDHRADIYSLGVVFYQMLTGELPGKKLEPPSKKIVVDVRLDEVVLRALEREPERRYQRAGEVKTIVETIVSNPPPPETGQPEGAPSRQAARITPAQLERIRWFIWARALIACIAAVIFGTFLHPPLLGIAIASWGLIGCAATSWKAFGSRRNQDEDRAALKAANRISLIQALGVLAAGLTLASINSGLADEWNLFLAVLMGCAIIVCILRLAGLWPFGMVVFPSDPPPVDDGERRGGWWPVLVSLAVQIAAALPLLAFATFIVPKFETIVSHSNLNGFVLPRLTALIVRAIADFDYTFGYKYNWFSILFLPLWMFLSWVMNWRGGRKLLRRWTVGVAALLFALTVIAVAAVIVPMTAIVPALNAGNTWDLQQELKAADAGNQWAVYYLWDAYYRGRHGIQPDPAKADKWLRQFVRNVWVVRFEPLGDFAPKDPKEFLTRIENYSSARSGETTLGVSGFFRTTNQDGKLAGSFLSNDPDQLKAELAKVPGLKVTSVDRITPEAFVEYEQSPQESLMRRDAEVYTTQELQEIESLYQVANQKWQTEAARISLLTLVKKYPKANRTGCAILYLGQMSQGDEQIAYLKQAIADYGDCYYGDGVQVGAYARFLLGQIYQERGSANEAQTLFKDIRSNYPKSIDHAGHSLVAQLPSENALASKQTTSAQVAAGPADTRLESKVKYASEQASVQDIVRSLAEQVSLKYDWQKSFDQTNPICSQWVRNVAIEGKTCNEALEQILKPVGLRYEVKDGVLSLSRQTGNTPAEGDPILSQQPPVVVETMPVSGSRDVAPGEAEIRVRFSKDMAPGSWSWTTAWENSAPEFVGQPHYEADGRTCVTKVSLKPGRTYAFWLNSGKFQNFKDDTGHPAIPYLLIFQTKQE